ncbi:MAG: HD domain-containing protein [Verrucomicrobia bacterium]|nr:HD domain-containing protein [Verrucomicrobiota bacterium]
MQLQEAIAHQVSEKQIHPKRLSKLYDPVHQFIYLDQDEAALIDSLPFQRLRYIRQMGTSYLVYPGATHSRFEHSLGVMELASQIFDRILDKFHVPGLDSAYWRKIVRLAALCHDVGHLPFSHVAEKALLGKGGHEKWTYQIIQSSILRPLWEKLQVKYSQPDLIQHITQIAIGEKKLQEMGHPLLFSPWERVMCEIITGDFFGADRIDYLLRDAKSTGVSYGLFDYHQLIETIHIIRQAEGNFELGIEENGIESCEALLLARHFMHRRVYQYATVKSYNFHLARFMEKTVHLADLNHYLTLTDNDVIVELFKAVKDPEHVGYGDAQSILERKHRYKAVAVGPEISLEDLKNFQQTVPPGAIAWDFIPKGASKMGLTFPVLLKTQKIINGSALSTLSIPTGSNTWVYLDPKYEDSFQQYLQT